MKVSGWLRLFFVSLLLGHSAVADEAGVPASPESLGLSTPRLEALGDMVRRHVQEKKLGGAVVLVARHGKIAYFETFGQADEGKPMQQDALFRIASMSKPLTTLAVLKLYEEGRLLLSDPVSKYIPEFKQPQVLVATPEGAKTPYRLVPADREITVRDLLAHTAGLTYGFLSDWFPDPVHQQMTVIHQEAGIGAGVQETEGRIGDMVKRLARLPLANQPGVFEYGMSPDVSGYLVEVVSGMKLDVFMREKIFKPLKMNSTWFYPPESELPRLSALWRTDWNGMLEKIPDGLQKEGSFEFSSSFSYKGPKTYFSGAGGLHSTAYDYFRFCQMLLNKGELDGEHFLSPKTVELMTATNHIGAANATFLHDDGWKFGLGVAIQQDREHNVDSGTVGNFEWAGIFSTRFSVDPKEEKVVIFMSQTHPFVHHFKLWDKILVMSNAAILE